MSEPIEPTCQTITDRLRNLQPKKKKHKMHKVVWEPTPGWECYRAVCWQPNAIGECAATPHDWDREKGTTDWNKVTCKNCRRSAPTWPYTKDQIDRAIDEIT